MKVRGYVSIRITVKAELLVRGDVPEYYQD